MLDTEALQIDWLAAGDAPNRLWLALTLAHDSEYADTEDLANCLLESVDGKDRGDSTAGGDAHSTDCAATWLPPCVGDSASDGGDDDRDDDRDDTDEVDGDAKETAEAEAEAKEETEAADEALACMIWRILSAAATSIGVGAAAAALL